LVFNKMPGWINQKIEDNNIDLFLLCNNDIQWIPDSVRENGGEMRGKLLEIYKEELRHYKCNFKIVKGVGETRFNNALKLVNEFLDLKNRK
jgi:nicotinamide riboside kinase